MFISGFEKIAKISRKAALISGVAAGLGAAYMKHRQNKKKKEDQ